MDQLQAILDLLSKGAMGGGVFLAIWGLISLGTSLSQGGGGGAENSNAIWKIIGGVIVFAAGALFTSIAGIF